MTRKSPRHAVDDQFWRGRLSTARSYLKMAERALAQMSDNENAVAIRGTVATAAIAFADAVTARRASVVNQRDHKQVTVLLNDVLGGELPLSRKRFLERTVGSKDETHYGVRFVPVEEARQSLAELQAFAAWAEELLR